MSAFVNGAIAIEQLPEKPPSFPGTLSRLRLRNGESRSNRAVTPPKWAAPDAIVNEADGGSPASVLEDEDVFSSCSGRFGSGRSEGQNSDYYDADDIFKEDEAMSDISSGGDQAKVLELRLKLEVANRLRTEEALEALRVQRDELAMQLPALKSPEETIPLEEHRKTLVIARLVSAAIARGKAKAEGQVDLELVVARKERELNQLKEKLRYLERVNRELMERREEAKEAAAIKRRKKERQRAVVVSGVGAVLALGLASFAVYVTWQWSTPPTVDVIPAEHTASCTDVDKSVS